MDTISFAHDATFKIIASDFYDAGIYRILLDMMDENKVAVIRIDAKTQHSPGGRKPKLRKGKKKKKPPLPLLTRLEFFNRDHLIELEKNHFLIYVDMEYNVYDLFGELDDKDERLFKRRKKAMREALDLDVLKDEIYAHKSLNRLIKRSMEEADVSKAFAYKCLSLLVRFGFDEKSLNPRYRNCGAPGIARPCDPGGRAKAGRKTNDERISKRAGELPKFVQPGMSTAWTEMILAADSKIKNPKPGYPTRADRIKKTSFFKKFRFNSEGGIDSVKPAPGSYPNERQIIRILKKEIKRINRLIERTTKAHFTRSRRGVSGYNWEGVSGPGHTWAIDSTIGDIYLRSSINRAWIIGRPIVYVIVDIWSTAVVGFFVALSGPSWEMASTSIFLAAIGEDFKADLWGRDPKQVLFPSPTLCAELLCDRGEYLSINARNTALKLKFCADYNPPYRPDLKGLVEVLHRIAKDVQYPFLPGAIDARRKEFDLRKFNPEHSVLTVPEYVLYLESVFRRYNLTANRSHRLDAHMKAQGVYPTPAGLWAWGHQVGIGYQKYRTDTNLITTLLPKSKAMVTPKGVKFGGNYYESPEFPTEEMTAIAKADGNWDMPCQFFPGPVKKIWVPHPNGNGILDMEINEFSNASEETTWDEVVDSHIYSTLDNALREHQNTMNSMAELEYQQQIIESAKKATAQAIAEHADEDRPTSTEARAMEAQQLNHQDDTGAVNPDSDEPLERCMTEGKKSHLETLSSLLPAVSGGN